ncbi:MAG: hypothetical protein Q7S07_02565 [Candidatus Omnitrophota bacterium]|nr:hypothetical protein [Candidatus Omnitrophota bacterium]
MNSAEPVNTIAINSAAYEIVLCLKKIIAAMIDMPADRTADMIGILEACANTIPIQNGMSI